MFGDRHDSNGSTHLISLHRDKHFRPPITHQGVIRGQLYCLVEQRKGFFSIPAPLYGLASISVQRHAENKRAHAQLSTHHAYAAQQHRIIGVNLRSFPVVILRHTDFAFP
jgi:hypothetical protein